MKKQTYILPLSFVLASLVMLPHCTWLGEKKDSAASTKTETMANKETTPAAMGTKPPVAKGEVLIEMYDTKVPKATIKDFQEYMDEFLEAQPQYKAVIEMMPGAEEQIFEGLKNELVLGEWVEKNGIAKKPEYLKDLEKIEKFGRRSLNVKYFQEAHPINVSDSEIRKYYDDNKNTIPQLMVEPGGVNAQAVFFENKADAQAFFDKVKDMSANFEAAAKEANNTVKDLGSVNNQSFNVDSAVRKKVLEMKKFPSVELIQVNDKSFAVVKVMSKKDPQYVPFDQVKPGIENMLKQQKIAEVLNKELEKLAQQYQVIVNKEYFERKNKAKEQEASTPEMPKKPTEKKSSVPMKAM